MIALLATAWAGEIWLTLKTEQLFVECPAVWLDHPDPALQRLASQPVGAWEELEIEGAVAFLMHREREPVGTIEFEVSHRRVPSTPLVATGEGLTASLADLANQLQRSVGALRISQVALEGVLTHVDGEVQLTLDGSLQMGR